MSPFNDFVIEFPVINFVAQPPKFTGKATLFHNKAQFFLLAENNSIITNNKKLRPFVFHFNKNKPNKKFIYSNFISGIFKFLNFHRLPSCMKKKYFTCIRRHLLNTASAIKRRFVSKSKNNNQTKTFFRFSVGQAVYYFGLYTPCNARNCSILPTHVTKHGAKCWIHWKEHCKRSTPPPPIHYPEFPKAPKRITSSRLGVTYTKDLVYMQASNSFLVIYRSLNRSSFNPKCIKRFDRLTRSPASNNRSFLVYQQDRTTFRRCKHLPNKPLELDLTEFVYYNQHLIDIDFNTDSVEIDLTQLANHYFDLD